MRIAQLDLNSPEFLADPYPFYDRIRSEGKPVWLPLVWEGPSEGMWLVTEYEQVAGILKEIRISKNAQLLPNPPAPTPMDRTMLFQDPPDHTRLRALANQAFTPARIRTMEAQIVEITDALLNRMSAEGPIDFIADFAMPLPCIVIAQMLGVPVEDQDQFRSWSNQIVASMDAIRSTEEKQQRQFAASGALVAYFMALIRKRREHPGDDILSALIAAHDTGDRLSEEELVGTCMLLLIAGHETTVNLLGNGMLTLLRFPEQKALLQAHPELVPSAVEEMLRYESPVQRGTIRFAAHPFEIGGHRFEPGAQVSAVLGAANRDPEQFPDPGRFDITRTPNRHLAFGLGIHFCIGSALARAEARIGFTRFLARFPHLRGDVSTPRWNNNSILRGLQTLTMHA